MTAAKLSLGPTIEDDADIVPHRLQKSLGVTRERALRGCDRNSKVVKVDNTVSVQNIGNKSREMERKGSNIFVQKGSW